MANYTSKMPEGGWSSPLWEMQPGEGPKPFEAFAIYRDLGPERSIRAVATTLGKSTTIVGTWSAQWGWVDRTAAWDRESDRLTRERDLVEDQRARREMVKSHTRNYAFLHDVGRRALDRYDPKLPGADPEEIKRQIAALKPIEAAKLMEVGSRNERIARGENQGQMVPEDALAWAEGLIDLALGYLPLEGRQAFLRAVDEKLGIGAMVEDG